MTVRFTTIDEMITALAALPISVRSHPPRAWTNGCGVVISGLEIITEDHIDPIGEGCIPVSEYEGLQSEHDAVVPQGTVMFTVGTYAIQCPECQEHFEVTNR